MFHAGDLPWKPLACEHVSSTSSSSPIAMLKKECQTDPSLMFPRGSIYLPQIAQINEYIGKLSFADIPDYRYLKDILDSVTPSDVPESRKETKDNHIPIPDESDTLNKSCTGDGTIKRSHQTLSELITVLQEVCLGSICDISYLCYPETYFSVITGWILERSSQNTPKFNKRQSIGNDCHFL